MVLENCFICQRACMASVKWIVFYNTIIYYIRFAMTVHMQCSYSTFFRKAMKIRLQENAFLHEIQCYCYRAPAKQHILCFRHNHRCLSVGFPWCLATDFILSKFQFSVHISLSISIDHFSRDFCHVDDGSDYC